MVYLSGLLAVHGWFVSCEKKQSHAIILLYLLAQVLREKRGGKQIKTLYLPEENVAVCAQVQRVTVLLSVRIATAQLEVHLLPLQMTLI